MEPSNESTACVAHVFSGTFVHSTLNTPLEILDHTVLGVGNNGKVCYFLLFH